jgi:hypothetical protein
MKHHGKSDPAKTIKDTAPNPDRPYLLDQK